MNLFENLIKYYESDELTELLEMAKLMPDQANKDNCGELDVYIYFSPCQDSHGPRIKFYGGSKETRDTRKAPSYTFSVNGAEHLELQTWMNKKNCPNAFDKNIVNNVSSFINKTLPILLLVWFYKLDESRALYYFQGHYDFNSLLNYIDEVDEETKRELLKSKDLNDLHDKCKRYSVYNF